MSEETTIEFKGNAFDLEVIPSSSVLALARRGLARYLGSEIAAKIADWVEREKKAGDAPTDAEVEEKKATLLAAAIDAINEGTITVGRAGGMASDPVEAEIVRLAKAAVRETLKKAGISFHRAGEKGQPHLVTLADGEYTLDDLVARYVANPKHAGLRAEAEANIAKLAASPIPEEDLLSEF